MILTIDANIWLGAEDPAEPGHAVCTRFLERSLPLATDVCSPTLLIVELAAAIARKTRREEDGRRIAERVAALRIHRWYPLDIITAELARDLAARCFIRGADAVYAAVASRSGGVLVSQDQQLLSRAAVAVETLSPERWLVTYPE